MAASQRESFAGAFAAMHRSSSGFVMPNAWDAGSAVIFAEVGFKAIATTSAGIAFSLAKPDYAVRDSRQCVAREEMFERIRQIVDAVALPVNGDLEAGYGDSPEDVAETIRMAIESGLSGGNIEDRNPIGPEGQALYDEALAVERIAAARAAIDAAGRTFVLTARTDVFLDTHEDALAKCIRRGNPFREAGADCVFTPGVSELDVIRTLTREIECPINIVMGLGSASGDTSSLMAAGVQRVSLGGSIARAALGFIRSCVAELYEQGTIRFATRQIAQRDLNDLFSRRFG